MSYFVSAFIFITSNRRYYKNILFFFINLLMLLMNIFIYSAYQLSPFSPTTDFGSSH